MTELAIDYSTHVSLDLSTVACENLSKAFGGVQAVHSVSLALGSGEFVALLGPSGCGKTTVLRLIAGLETPDSGTIAIGGRLVAGRGVFVSAHLRRVGMVFQDYALFPHMTVEQNIAYGLPRRGPVREGAARRERVSAMLDLVGLAGVEKRFPHELSGGQQQRIALARALAPQPEILLLDEPFSNLDVALRTQVREEVQRILQAAGVTVILVTHDQDEAMSLADRVALMFDGSLAQVGSPRTLYEQPVSRRAAQFLGEANLLPGTAHGPDAITVLGEVPLQQPGRGEIEVLLRPEHLVLHANPGTGTPAQVARSMYYGTHQDVWVALADSTALKVRCPAHERWRAGDRVAVQVIGRAVAFAAE